MMLCPNDRIEMRPVKVMSHYDQQIDLEQCDTCGGIWFDESELYRAKQGEAGKIEFVNSEILRNPTVIEAAALYCPRDKAVLQQFTDKYFPHDIILERCPSCQGIWLNRGTFTRYQKYRKELLRPKVKSPDDKQLGDNINQLIAAHNSGQSSETLRKLGKFLSAPMDDNLSQRSALTGNAAGIALNLIMAILRAFIFKF